MGRGGCARLALDVAFLWRRSDRAERWELPVVHFSRSVAGALELVERVELLLVASLAPHPRRRGGRRGVLSVRLAACSACPSIKIALGRQFYLLQPLNFMSSVFR